MSAATAQSVQYLNLAYFGRPADPASLDAYPASGVSNEAIVASFVGTGEYVTNTVNPNSAANASGGRTFNETNLINTFYQRLFGRLASSSEIAGWSTALATGTVNHDYLGITILNAGLNLPEGTEMRDVLIATFDSAQLFTGNLYNNPANAQSYSTAAAVQSGITFLAGVTTTTAATAAEANAAVTTMVTGSGSSGGEAFTLTTTVDTIQGTASDDTVNAVISDQAAGATLNSFDNISLGAGDNVMNARVATLGAAVTVAPTLNNVDTVNVSNVDNSGNIATVNLTSTGTSTVGFVNTGAASETTILAAAADATVVLDNADASGGGANASASVNLLGAATRTGNADALILTIRNGSGTAAAVADFQTVGANGAAADNTFEVLNITTGGAANFVNISSGSNAVRTITATGATTPTSGAGLTLTEAGNFVQLRTVDASGMTGGGIDLTTTAQQALTFTGSGADDRLVVTAGIANINGLDTFTFGDGNDTLAIGTNTAIANYTAAQAGLINSMTGLENLEFTAAMAAAGSTLNAAAFNYDSFTFSTAGVALSTGAGFAITGANTADPFSYTASQTPAAVAAGANGANGAAGAGGQDLIDFTGAVVGSTANLSLGGAAAVALTGQTGGAGGNSTGANNAGAAGGAGGRAVDFTNSITKLIINSGGTAANTITGGAGGAGGNAGAGNAAGGAGGAGQSAIDNGAAVQSVDITGAQNLTIAGGLGGAGGTGVVTVLLVLPVLPVLLSPVL